MVFCCNAKRRADRPRSSAQASRPTELDHAVSDGLLKTTSLDGIFDLTLLNQELTKAGQPTVPTS